MQFIWLIQGRNYELAKQQGRRDSLAGYVKGTDQGLPQFYIFLADLRCTRGGVTAARRTVRVIAPSSSPHLHYSPGYLFVAS